MEMAYGVDDDILVAVISTIEDTTKQILGKNPWLLLLVAGSLLAYFIAPSGTLYSIPATAELAWVGAAVNHSISIFAELEGEELEEEPEDEGLELELPELELEEEEPEDEGLELELPELELLELELEVGELELEEDDFEDDEDEPLLEDDPEDDEDEPLLEGDLADGEDEPPLEDDPEDDEDEPLLVGDGVEEDPGDPDELEEEAAAIFALVDELPLLVGDPTNGGHDTGLVWSQMGSKSFWIAEEMWHERKSNMLSGGGKPPGAVDSQME
ncbi:hypothetical protein EDC05_002661 [Coemansia umbellata]|uniref:Uncharacterized protein n=1 Tax=Coemansia umbellata TaxID=1424467 RepID=A0ABQ8PNF1_9FUNG|nr:hypothetical protein EDC05_002661 [Coemansia umbellata]